MGTCAPRNIPSGGVHVETVEGADGHVRSRDGHVEQRCPGAPARRLRHAADEPMGDELLVHQELPDGGEPVQRGQHAPHELRHRVLGRPRVRRRLRRFPDLRHLEAGADAREGRALLRTAGRSVGVRHRPRRRRGHASAVGRQRPRRTELRSRAGEQERHHRPLSRRCLGGPARLRHLGPDRPPADRGGLPGLRVAHQHAAAGARRPVDVRAELELPARRGPDVRPARRGGGPQGQPRRRAGHRGAVQRPVQGARAHRAADRLPG